MGTIRSTFKAYSEGTGIDIDTIIAESIEETKTIIIGFNKENLKQGFKIDGTRIGTYASLSYAAKKFAQNSAAGFGNIDLFLSGDWANAITVRVNKKSFTTFSINTKALKLETKYSKLIYGLPNKYKDEYIQILKPIIIRRIKEATNS